MLRPISQTKCKTFILQKTHMLEGVVIPCKRSLNRHDQQRNDHAEFNYNTQGDNLIMPKYIIEREIPGAGKLTASELQGISAKSCGVLREMGPTIQWVESSVTEDKIYCVYIAPNEEMVVEHAKQGGFPANKISEVVTTINPTTAE